MERAADVLPTELRPVVDGLGIDKSIEVDIVGVAKIYPEIGELVRRIEVCFAVRVVRHVFFMK
ncbi:hypothetical protein D3C78_1951750 [compost metagenome]